MANESLTKAKDRIRPKTTFMCLNMRISPSVVSMKRPKNSSWDEIDDRYRLPLLRDRFHIFAFKKKRGIGPMSDTFPDFDFSFSNPTDQRLPEMPSV